MPRTQGPGCTSLVKARSASGEAAVQVCRAANTKLWRRLHALLTSPRSSQVTKRNLHLTADISGGFLTFLARRVPCAEFPSRYLNTAAALTLRNSWTLRPPSTFAKLKSFFCIIWGKKWEPHHRFVVYVSKPLLINDTVIMEEDQDCCHFRVGE